MRCAALFSAVLAVSACAPASPVSRADSGRITNLQTVANWTPARCSADPGLAQEQQRLLTEVNEVRRQHGLGPVRFEARLATAAHEHACANARNGVISHIGEGGSRPGHRALRAGYDYQIVAENLGLGFHGAAQAMFYWMRSPGHRSNVLKPQVRDAALGLAQTARGQRTWVLMLGESR